MKKKLIYGVAIAMSMYGAYVVGCIRGAIWVGNGVLKVFKNDRAPIHSNKPSDTTFVYANYMEDFGDDELNELLS